LNARLFHPKGQFDVGVLFQFLVFLHPMVSGGEEEVADGGEGTVDDVADFGGVVGRRVGGEWVG
jgi:hypothetical protein